MKTCFQPVSALVICSISIFHFLKNDNTSNGAFNPSRFQMLIMGYESSHDTLDACKILHPSFQR